MRIFFKRNRMIKLFTIGWMSLMFIISMGLLLGIPSQNEGGHAGESALGGNKVAVAVIEIPISALLNSVVIVNSGDSTGPSVLTLMPDSVNETENGSANYTEHCGNTTFISIGGDDMNCVVIIAGGSRESSEAADEIQSQQERSYEL